MTHISSNINFSSKADVLLQLMAHDVLHIPPVYRVCFTRWQHERESVMQEIIVWAKVYGKNLAVRSSCTREDGQNTSGAGAFTSLLHISHTCRESIVTAINTVLASYGEPCAQDQVFLQPMVENIAVSGVIMTRVLDDGSPYYAINYDDESGKTDSITAGFGGTKTVYVYREAQESDFDSQRLLSFVRLAKKIEELCERNDLDIEFCQSHEGTLYVLQVRPICSQHQWLPKASVRVARHMDFIVDFVRKRAQPWLELHGKSTILGIMPDWNPAEIIGVTPRLLATSLYRELVTRRVWSKARESMGYKAMPPEELMILLAGRPYIDVRVSLNSFLPQGLDAGVGELLVSAWLTYLDTNPHLHDKIEFDVAQTLLDFCFDTHLEQRYAGLLTVAQKRHFRACLQRLTNACLDMRAQGSMAQAFAAVELLQTRQKEREEKQYFTKNKEQNENSFLPRMTLLCEECKELGTFPFAILARHAFMAEALLRTAVERGALQAERLVAFKQSIHTVSGELSRDFLSVGQGVLTQEAFLAQYGHLRPSTYDIMSPCYAHKENLFGSEVQSRSTVLSGMHTEPFVFTAKEEQSITALMQEAGLRGDVHSLAMYARKAIAGREWAKFVFSKNISQVLELMAQWGSLWGLDRDTLSFLDMRHILEWSSHALLKEPKAYFESRAIEGRELYNLSRSLKLGYLIRSTRDVYIVPQHRSAPNYIGTARVEAPVVHVTAHSSCSVDIAHCIVCIENADPGFDWIFTRNIAGLITKFGGTNSHMAIRCAEYALPAVIGAGEVLFEKMLSAKRCILNAENHSLQAL